MSSLGYGQGTWGNNPWGGFISVDVSVTGFGLTSSLGTIPAVHSDAPLPIILGWGEGGWNQNRWGGRVSTAFGVNDDGFSVTGSVGSVTVTGTGAVSLTGVSATATLDFDSTTDIVINETAVIDFRDSLMATSFSPEFGLTVDGFVQDGQVIGVGSDLEDITNTERGQDIFLAAEMDLPSSFTKASAIWDCGSTGSGAWFGISEQSGAYFLRLRGGNGTDGNNTAASNLTIAQVAVSTLPQFFDGNTHTVAWGFDLSAGRAVIFIDGTLVADGTTSDGSSISSFAGGADGAFGFANGAAGGVSDDGSTQFQSNDSFTGTIRSDLRMYKNEFFTAQTAPASFVGSVSVGVTQSQISSNIGSVDFDGDANVPITGFEATTALGDETVITNVSFAVTGLAGTTALGDEVAAPQTIVSPSGSAGTGAVGNVTPVGASNHTATGSVGTGAVGNATPIGASNHTATGSVGTGSAGTLTIVPSIEVVPTGAEGTGGTGTPFVGGGAKVVEDGLTGSVNIGDEAVSAGANVFPTGISASGFISNPASGTLGDVITLTVTVQEVSGANYYFIDGVQQQTVTLIEGKTYHFDQSDSSNDGHPLRLSTTSNGTHAGGSAYTNGVTAIGTPGTSGAYTAIEVADDQPTLYYYCSNHSGMGGTANTFNSTVNIVGASNIVATTNVGTGAVGTASVLPSIEVDVTTVIGTTGVGTLAITAGGVVLLTGVNGTGVIATSQIFSIIKPTQVANWVEKAA